MAKSNGKDFALGVVIGGALGVVSALIFAPKHGKKAHKKIRKQLEDINETTHELVEKIEEIEERIGKGGCCKS